MKNTEELKSIVQIDNSEFPCNLVDDCSYNERTLSYALGVKVPSVDVIDPGIVFTECGYNHYVFADLESFDDYKNDYSGFYYQRQLNNENVIFELHDLNTGNKQVLDNSTYGQFFGFGSFQSNLNFIGYRLDWKKVIEQLGEGVYQVITTVSKIGISTTYLSYVFNLRQYNTELIDKTTRIDIVMNGFLEKSGVDFTDINWKHSIRIGGFFGRRNPSFEERNIVNRRFNNKQVSIHQTNEYKFQSNLIPDCLSNEIFDFILMANDIYLNDYNLNNHSYNFVKFGVKVGSIDEPVYSNTSRKVQLNIVFIDKILNNMKRNYK